MVQVRRFLDITGMLKPSRKPWLPWVDQDPVVSLFTLDFGRNEGITFMLMA